MKKPTVVTRKPRVRHIYRERQWKLPSNQYAETVILGAVLLDNAAFPDGLECDDFSLDSHRCIWNRMMELKAQGSAIDIVTLEELLRVNKDHIAPTPIAYLAGLTEGLPRRPVIGDYIKIVKEKAKLRRIMKVSEQAILQCQSQLESAEGIVKTMADGLKGIRKGKP